uniref:Uncharacterized protein n=1 Tax=Rhizophora mucronata TaxID=61149 RepID=A0A2P2PWW1_RHIMU
MQSLPSSCCHVVCRFNRLEMAFAYENVLRDILL